MKVGDKVKCCTLTDGLRFNGVYVVKDSRDDGYCLELEGVEGAWWHSSRFELIKEEPMADKFNPKPGDKIICNNGVEFICCTLDILRDKITKQIHSSLPILGYYKTEYDESWQDWNEDGTTRCNDFDYGIREVIPAESKEVVKEEEPRYSASDIQEAFNRMNIPQVSYPVFMGFLQVVSSKEYKEYLRLKAIYE